MAWFMHRPKEFSTHLIGHVGVCIPACYLPVYVPMYVGMYVCRHVGMYVYMYICMHTHASYLMAYLCCRNLQQVGSYMNLEAGSLVCNPLRPIRNILLVFIPYDYMILKMKTIPLETTVLAPPSQAAPATAGAPAAAARRSLSLRAHRFGT